MFDLKTKNSNSDRSKQPTDAEAGDAILEIDPYDEFHRNRSDFVSPQSVAPVRSSSDDR